MTDVDLASFENNSAGGPSAVLPASHDASVPLDDLCDFMHFVSNNLSSTQFHESSSQEYLLALGGPVLGNRESHY